MSFREDYKKSYDNIVPDKEFIDRLSERMEEEKGKKQVLWKRPVMAVGIIVFLVIGVFLFRFFGAGRRPTEPLRVQTETLPSPSSEITAFTTPQWYDSGDKPEEIAAKFAGRMVDGEQLTALYQSGENDFTEEEQVSEKEVRRLAERLRTAALSSGQKPSGDTVYYMAEFQNGDIIKFTVTEDTYFSFLEPEYVFLLQD